MDKLDIISYIRNHFPTTRTQDVTDFLNLSIYHIRKIAKEHNIAKCPAYHQRLKEQLVIARRKWYEQSIPDFIPTHEQEQIILGSLLGDGYISKGAERSLHYYYQEHFGESQREYREWKLQMLASLDFSIHGNFLRSKSHPYFNKLHTALYPNDVKSLSQAFLARCTHPLFLTTLYLDDGSLTISYQYNKKKNTVYCHPSILLYTLNFTRIENKRLAAHLNQTFGTQLWIHLYYFLGLVSSDKSNIFHTISSKL